ncbi:transposase domain-containing protein, partial [Escherichia coli]
FANDGSQLLTIFEIKLNGADFFFFSKHVLSPESPGNRPHPHYCLISLALTLFAGSDSGGEHAAVLYSLIGTCRLNNVEPEKWLRYVIEHIQDWPANRVRDLLPWKVDLTSQ